MRWLSLGRKAGAGPFIAIGLGIGSGYYIFDQPLREYVEAKAAEEKAAKAAEKK
jgi:hypothetical protein